MAIYGEEPASDSLALVVCELCGRVVKSQALSKHKGVCVYFMCVCVLCVYYMRACVRVCVCVCLCLCVC